MAATGVAVVLAARAAFGFAGRTALPVPGSGSPRFERLDRRVDAPLCALLAAGAANAARRPGAVGQSPGRVIAFGRRD